jgi:hypothetical protein
MHRHLTLSVPWAPLFTLMASLTTHAGMPSAPKSPEGLSVRTYTKVWTDDYRNYHKDVYVAYVRTLKDEKGDEVLAEIWHGKATGFHENGNKAWEGEYRHGKREGEFASWADNGTRTGLATYQHGLMQGKYSQWNHDGRKMREETYEKGKVSGEARWWDGDGKLLTTGVYRDGEPWTGSFSELDASPDRGWVIRRYEAGKKVQEEKLTGNWWW